MTHATHEMHENSLFTWAEERARLSARAKQILENLKTHGKATDREMAMRLGFTECNSVRPRITEMIDAGLVHEVDTVICPITGKRVRVVEAVQ